MDVEVNAVDVTQPDPAWRAEMMAEVASGDVARATDALLSLTNHEADRSWIESVLLRIIDGNYDLQVRQLAVICLGHVARIHRDISESAVSKLKSLVRDPDFSSRSANALEDIEIFVKR
jgi:hypothetical protein